MKEFNPTKYVTLKGVAMRLSDDKKSYYRDAGQWSVEWSHEEGKLVSWCLKYSFLHRVELLEISKDQWKQDNEGYV